MHWAQNVILCKNLGKVSISLKAKKKAELITNGCLLLALLGASQWDNVAGVYGCPRGPALSVELTPGNGGHRCG